MNDIDTGWLIRLRWLTLFALGVAFASAFVLPGMMAPHGMLVWLAFVILAATAVSNLVLGATQNRLRGRGWVTIVLAGDALALSALLASTGGSMNPFTALYFVHIALAATLLTTRAALFVVATCVVGFASLFLLPTPHSDHHAGLAAHLQGMWLAFVISASLIAVFVLKLHRDLERTTEKAARSKQVAALTTLAASAAHELGSPIGTIALAAESLEEQLGDPALSTPMKQDIQLIRDEVERCRQVLRSLSTTAGGTVGEGLVSTRLGSLLEEARSRLGPRALEVQLDGTLDVAIPLPRAAVTLCLVNLMQNALEASSEPAKERQSEKSRDRLQHNSPMDRLEGSTENEPTVRVTAQLSGNDRVVFDVEDSGPGMSKAQQRQASDPFFSTKPGGRGLGLFLTRAVAEQLNGALSFHGSKPFVARLELGGFA